MKHRFAAYVENVGESGLACLLTMVQGNIAALTPSHWLVASETGLLAGAIVTATTLTAGLRRPWLVSLALGIATTAADALVHRAALGTAELRESVVTGVGAVALSAAVSLAVRALARSRRRGVPVR